MFAFLKANSFIDYRIRKGLLPKISGTFETNCSDGQRYNHSKNNKDIPRYHITGFKKRVWWSSP